MNESIHVTVSGSPWGLYGAFVLGALVTFCAIWGYSYLKSRGQKKDELEVLLGDIWEKFLDADHYAAEILHARMVLDNAEYYVNEFAKKLGCIEFIIESKSGLLGGTIYATARTVKDLMFEYQTNAMKSTFYKGIAIRNQLALNTYYSRKSLESANQCADLRAAWLTKLNVLDFEMKRAVA